MPVKKFYEFADVKSAIDMANEHYYKQLLRVRSDVSNAEFAQKSVKNHPATGSGMAWTGKGGDVGHAFRHVQGTHLAGKSTYEDDYEMVMCTRELLNSSGGQAVLGQLDTDNPTGEAATGGAPPKIKGAIKGVYYGFPTNSTDKKKIASAVCVVMKLGESTLWIHTTYPNSFVT
jgi:hypothetical protein